MEKRRERQNGPRRIRRGRPTTRSHRLSQARVRSAPRGDFDRLLGHHDRNPADEGAESGGQEGNGFPADVLSGESTEAVLEIASGAPRDGGLRCTISRARVRQRLIAAFDFTVEACPGVGRAGNAALEGRQARPSNPRGPPWTLAEAAIPQDVGKITKDGPKSHAAPGNRNRLVVVGLGHDP